VNAVVDLDLLYGADSWVIHAVFLLLMIGGIETGFRLGRRAASSSGGRARAQISVVEASLVGVLGLLLGFTMSMAVSRFEARKDLVLEEANAIGTSYLRTQLLPVPEGNAIASLLRDYLNNRIQFAAAGDDPGKLQAVREQGQRLQDSFWRQAVAYADKAQNPVLASLLLQSLNRVNDVESARWMAFYNHVPGAVMYLNAIVALATATLVGYAFGVEGIRHFLSLCLLVLAIAVALGVIVDLDRPRRGFIRVSQQPMLDLQRQICAPKH
jgi:hypothetical protein